MTITEAAVTEARARRCGLCQAAPDQPCRNICTGEELPGQTVHIYRLGAK